MAKTPTEIKSLARVHTDKALNVLARIMEQSDAPPAARVAAAQALLDRGWGKPNQTVEVEANITSKVIRTPTIAPDIASWMNEHGKETLQ